MNLRFQLIIVFVLTFNLSSAQNVTIIESQSANSGHVMDINWETVSNSMGFTTTIQPQSTLESNAFYPTTDILIVSSGVITLTANAITNISGYVQQGGHVYLQGEYDFTLYNTNTTFQQFVTDFGGGGFTYTGTIAGTLIPMNVTGTLSSVNNSIPPLSYFWYGCQGVINSGCNVEPFLEYQNMYFGFIFCAPNTGGGRVIQTTDQDWVNQNTSTDIMENILTNLNDFSFDCSTGSASLSLGSDTSVCPNSTLTLDAENPGSIYLWSTGETTQTISINTDGTYWVQVDNSGCTATDTIVISILPPINIDLGNDTTICINESVMLEAGLNLGNYLWSTGATTSSIDINSAGIYSVTVGPSGCSDADTIEILQAPLPNVFLGNDTSMCDSVNVLLDAGNAGSDFLWSDGSTSQTLFVNQPGAISVLVTSTEGCSASDVIVIQQYPYTPLNLGNDVTVCINDLVTLTASAGFNSYLWQNGNTNSSFTTTATGEYSVIATDNNQCNSYDTILVNNFPVFTFSMGDDVSLCPGDMITLSSPSGYPNYSWNTGAITNTIDVMDTGWYSVTITTNDNCTSSDEIHVDYQCELEVIVPNAFSPNGDGLNDWFKALSNMPIKVHLRIFNRWGQLVFETINETPGWDGTFGNVDCEIGSYAWLLEATGTFNGVTDTKFMQGSVTLIR